MEYKLLYENRKYSDPFKESTWVPMSQVKKYFKLNYDLELYQVWNLCNGFDKDQSHYCKSCNTEVYFKSLNLGYYDYCCKSCQSTGINKQSWSNSDYRTNQLNRLKAQWEDPNYVKSVSTAASLNMTKLNGTTEFQAKAHRNAFYNYKERLGYLYIHKIQGSETYKFGISVINTYLKFRGIPHHVLLKSTAINLADIEYELVLEFGSEVIDSTELPKFFHKLKLIKLSI